MIKGILIPYFETGMEGTEWACFEDGKEGYDGLHILTEEHHIKVYDENDNVIYNEDIVKDTFSNYESYPNNPVAGKQLAGNLWANWLQANAVMKDWLNMFSKEYKVEVTKSLKSKEEIKKIKEEIKNNYFKTRVFKKEILLKPKLMFNIEDPEFYQKKGADVVLNQLMSINFNYQIFDEKIYIIYVMQKEEMTGKKVGLSFINQENFDQIKIDAKKEKNKLMELHKYNKRNINKNIKIVFKEEEDITKEEKIFEKEFQEKLERLEDLKLEIGTQLLNEIKKAPKYILEGKGVENTAIKLLCFSKKDTNWLLKLKTN